MAHHVYQTEAFILKGYDSNDADRFLNLFTRELGLVKAVAKSARRERSKLRYSLQDYSVGNIALVRGRDVWRVTGAQEEYSMYHALKHDQKKLMLFGRIMFLLRRLLQGEERNEYLFETILSCFTFLEQCESNERTLKGVEYITTLRLLYSLGYVAKDDEMFETTTFPEKLLAKVLSDEERIALLIEHALMESHL